MTASSLFDFLLHLDGDTPASLRARLSEGAGKLEPARVSHSCSLDIAIGKSAAIMGYPIEQCDDTLQFAGWLTEIDDMTTVIIALRRMTARGA